MANGTGPIPQSQVADKIFTPSNLGSSQMANE